MNDEERILILGALLHDVGKFLERAGFTEKIENERIDYAHPKIGAHFLKDYLKLDKDITDLVLYHHNPSNAPENIRDLCCILQLADWLSSGEREESEEKIDLDRRYQCMISVFNRVKINKNTKDISYEKCDKYDIRPLKLDDPIFPKKNPAFMNYGHIFEGIKNPNNPNYMYFQQNNFKKEITENSIENYEILLSLLQKYWWCIPAQTYSEGVRRGKYLPDISLFDHSKTTCAIAVCLYKLYRAGVIDEGILKELLKNPPWEKNRDPRIWKEKRLFKLIHGDISGIQDFIYTIQSKGAAKSLKGRSLTLVLLQRFIAEHILKKLNLQLTNLIFSGGGHFYILAPYNIENLDKIKKEINEKLFDRFGAKLYLTLGCIDLCPEDFVDSNFSSKWRYVAEENSKQKLRKYSEFKYEKIFGEFDIGGMSKVCSICGSNKNVREYQDEDTVMDMCSDCISFRDIGGYLRKVQKAGRFNIPEIKKELSILSDFDTLLKENIYLTPDGLPFLPLPMGIPVKEMVNDGIRKEMIKEFDDLAKDAEAGTGTKKIAILKMDVDNLGKIFTQGLGEHATISRMSTLSNMLSLFFEGYLNELVKQKYSNDVYLIYAGGDDTLAVGRWDRMIDFAEDIYKRFRRYTCNNPDITISAGIVIVNPKYPLRKSVAYANELLDDIAKKEDKNAIGIFNYRLKWSIEEDNCLNEFRKVREIDDILVKSVKPDSSVEPKAPKQLIQRVKFSMEELKKGINGMEINLKYYWRLRYYLYRNFYGKDGWKYPRIEELENKIYKEILAENLFNKDEKYAIHLIPIAARIAELKTRKEG